LSAKPYFLVQTVFERFDRDRSGTIEGNELREALLSLGFNIPPQVLHILVSKYDTTGRGRSIEYDNFIEYVVTPHIAIRHSISQDNQVFWTHEHEEHFCIWFCWYCDGSLKHGIINLWSEIWGETWKFFVDQKKSTFSFFCVNSLSSGGIWCLWCWLSGVGLLWRYACSSSVISLLVCSLICGNWQSVLLFLRMEIGRIVQRRVHESENRTCEWKAEVFFLRILSWRIEHVGLYRDYQRSSRRRIKTTLELLPWIMKLSCSWCCLLLLLESS